MYGIFLEDINFAADGGLYAEKICNRSFEYDNPLQGWKTFGKVEVLSEGGPFDRNPHYVRFRYPGHPARQCGLENSGWTGIGLEKGAEYRLSFWARTAGKPRTVGLLAALCEPFGMPEFVRLIRQLWIDNQASLLSGLLDCLAETETLIGTAAQADMDRWGIDHYVHAEEYRKLRVWLTNRFRYLDGVIRNYPIHP